MSLILITSVINTSKNKLSYSQTRSKFTMEERYIQTKKTIESIKDKIKTNYKIMLIETSEIPEEYENFFKDNVDYYINIKNEDMINKTSSNSKSLGEGSQTIYALDYILENDIEFTNLIKISGRYFLSDKFELDKFLNDKIVVKKIKNNKNNILTALYKLPNNYVKQLCSFLKENIPKMKNCIGYEVLFANFVNKYPNNILYIEPVGLQGYVSVCGSFYDG